MSNKLTNFIRQSVRVYTSSYGNRLRIHTDNPYRQQYEHNSNKDIVRGDLWMIFALGGIYLAYNEISIYYLLNTDFDPRIIVKYIDNPSVRTMILIKKPEALQYIEDQKFELYKDALAKNPGVLHYVRDKTSIVCMDCVKINGLALKHVHPQTTQLQIEAVKQNGHAIRFVDKRTIQLWKLAVQRDATVFKYADWSDVYDDEHLCQMYQQHGKGC